jgi:deoxyribose-phosphate aldolase
MVGMGASRIGAALGVGEVGEGLAGMIDHTLLKPEATTREITGLCEEGRTYGFASVCVNPHFAVLAARLLRGTAVRVCSVAGFPLGANVSDVKAQEARLAVRDGAQEIDMVMNIGALKSGEYSVVEDDIRRVVRAAGPLTVVKVILETAVLTDEEKIKACLLVKAAGAHFVKTSTGFGPGGATVGDVALMRKVVGGELGIKASGGIRSQEEAIRMVRAGASRIGASASVKIVSGAGAGSGGY